MPSVRSACVALVGMGAAHAMYSYNHPGGTILYGRDLLAKLDLSPNIGSLFD